MKYKCIKTFMVSDIHDEEEWWIEVGSEWSCEVQTLCIRLENLSDDSWIEIDVETLTEHFEANKEEQVLFKENDKIVNTFTGESCTFITSNSDHIKIINSKGETRDIGVRYFERYYKPYSEDLKIKKLEELIKDGDI